MHSSKRFAFYAKFLRNLHNDTFEGAICCDDNSTTITCKKLRQATKKMKARSEKEGLKKINEKVLRQDMNMIQSRNF